MGFATLRFWRGYVVRNEIWVTLKSKLELWFIIMYRVRNYRQFNHRFFFFFYNILYVLKNNTRRVFVRYGRGETWILEKTKNFTFKSKTMRQVLWFVNHICRLWRTKTSTRRPTKVQVVQVATSLTNSRIILKHSRKKLNTQIIERFSFQEIILSY